jgi:shikimate kinase
MLLKLKRTPGIYLVGFMGSGKTTVGRLLGKELGWSFCDLDEDIEVDQKCSIATIFETRGEAEFRRIESQALARRVRLVERGRPLVVALGGGAFVQENNFELLENNGVSIWLDPPYGVIRRRVEGASHRPLARDPQKLEELYHSRRSFYERASYHIREADSPSAVASILRLPIF